MKSAGSVLAGLLTIFILSTAIDVVLHATGVFPPWGQPMSDGLFLLATAYRVAISIFGCYLAARLAPDKPMQHALTLGVIGVALSVAGTVATWNKGPEFGPHWYPLALIALAMPCAWIGARLRTA
jgi:peptidoglycan/LPS O-acetylase OafA/YrhL